LNVIARRGHQVFATMRETARRNAVHREALEQLAAAEGLRLRVLDLDVTSNESVERAVERALQEAGHIDVAINNAGVATLGISEAYTPEQFQSVFDVNVMGAVR
jgi:NAD(P)-dependent dehydrogenase (short-subunit alcohol dehydrogenase family)